MTPPGLAFVAANDAGAHGAQDGRPAHALLGLDLPRGRDPLPEVLRHAARAPAVRPAQGASTCCSPRGLENAIRRHALLAEATRAARGQVGRGPGAGLQHRQSGRAGQLDHLRPDAGSRSRSRCSTTAATSAAWCWASASANSPARPSAFAHMGHVYNAPMVLGTLGAVEMGLQALRIRTALAASRLRWITSAARWRRRGAVFLIRKHAE